jgi:hypothetical protein
MNVVLEPPRAEEDPIPRSAAAQTLTSIRIGGLRGYPGTLAQASVHTPGCHHQAVEKLLAFPRGLDETGTNSVVGHPRPDGVTVHVTAVPKERWEVDFFDDGTVEVERFRPTASGVTEADVDVLLGELRARRKSASVKSSPRGRSGTLVFDSAEHWPSRGSRA